MADILVFYYAIMFVVFGMLFYLIYSFKPRDETAFGVGDKMGLILLFFIIMVLNCAYTNYLWYLVYKGSHG